MNKSVSSRAIGVIIFLLGAFLIGLNGYLAVKKGSFFGIAAFFGPFASSYGVSVVIRPPAKMPQTELETIHSRFLGLGVCLGIVYFLVLKFVGLRKLV